VEIMAYTDIREEELKNKIAQNYFWQFDCTKIIGNLDFCVTMHQSKGELFEQESLLWAEAKKGTSDIYNSLVQLILTIGKARTFDKSNPPPFLGAIDSEKIAFVPYSEITEIFYVNDFNWNVAPSNYNTKEFSLIHEKVKSIIEKKALLFYYDKDEKELKNFIKLNFVVGKFGINKIRIDKNNFMIIYNKWLTSVKPFISADWELAKKNNIIDGDFYLADLLSEENTTLKDKLFVLLKKDKYEFARTLMSSGFFTHSTTGFKDNQVAHTQFWNKYERPPKEEYWEYIVSRRDLLVPQDVRERKGSFYTPQIWVELSQKYLADVLGEDWQDEYYIWDCAAGTGNLLNGLTNKRNIWASTLDQQDVEVMKDRIKNGANLFEDHVFQFDFLNDDFTKLPIELQKILNDPEKRKKLVMYINPPYAEAGNTKQRVGSGENKNFVSNLTNIHSKYFNILKNYAKRELFIQFFTRIYSELNGVILAEFSTLKIIQAPYFKDFRSYFLSKLETMFIMPASTFDNVNGNFPIGFFIWNTNKKELFEKIEAKVYLKDEISIGKKTFYSFDNDENINNWLRPTWKSKNKRLGYLTCNSNDFQNSISVFIQNDKNNQTSTYYKPIVISNLIESVIYLSVRHCINATWINDRDQFLSPNKKWTNDKIFQSDCLTFTLFHKQNRIKNTKFINYWLPFTEDEVNCSKAFESNFMTQFIKGKLKSEQNNLFDSPLWRGGSEADGVVSSTNKLKRNTKTIFDLPFNPELKERAKELRKSGNLSEVLFWNEVKNGKYKGIDFDRQRIIGNYIVDFYCPNYNVVIEIDGCSHNDKEEYDNQRDTFLQGLGLEVIHINDLDIKNNLSSVINMLNNHIAFQADEFEETTPSDCVSHPSLEGNLKDGNSTPLVFSDEAKAVFDAGRELWRYYHKQPNINVNASLYDIREHFQGRNAKGKMNNKSTDQIYTELIGELRDKIKLLAQKIEPKVYDYGFLKE